MYLIYKPPLLSHSTCLIAIMLASGGSLSASTITFFVSTSSSSTGGDDLPCTTCVQSNGQATYNTNTGASTQTVGTATANGTADILGLTSSFDQTSASGFGLLAPNPPINAGSYAAADLSEALVRASASGNNGVANNGAVAYGMGNSTVELFDTLTFHVAGATSSTITNIGVNTSLSGSASVMQGGGNVEITDTFVGFGADAQFFDDFGNLQPTTIGVNQIGWVSENVVSATTSSFIFQGVASGQGATFSTPIDLKLVLSCQGATCDYSDTATVSLNLPSNVTLTSASGVFATQSAAPEPASWAMMLPALILLVGIRRRRRCRRSA